MDKKEQEILNAMEKMGAEHAKEIEDGVEAVVNNVLKNHVTPQEAMGISPQKIEGIYAQGYQLFNSGRYKKALKTFDLLITLVETDPRFFMAGGACHHKLGNYKKASEYYGFSASIDQESPIPLYHAVDCCIEEGDKLSAAILLQMVIDRCQDKDEYSLIKDRAIIMKKTLIQEINEKGIEVPPAFLEEEKDG